MGGWSHTKIWLHFSLLLDIKAPGGTKISLFCEFLFLYVFYTPQNDVPYEQVIFTALIKINYTTI